MYLLFDDTSPDYYIARRSDEELRPEVTQGLLIGESRMISATIGVTRES